MKMRSKSWHFYVGYKLNCM